MGRLPEIIRSEVHASVRTRRSLDEVKRTNEALSPDPYGYQHTCSSGNSGTLSHRRQGQLRHQAKQTSTQEHCSGNQCPSPDPLEAPDYSVLDFSTSNTTIDIFMRSSWLNRSRSILRSSRALWGEVPLEDAGSFCCAPNQSTTYTP